MPFNINDAVNIVRPLTREQQKELDAEMLRIATELHAHKYRLGTDYIQDAERPLCIGCGEILDILGVCPECGRVKERSEP